MVHRFVTDIERLKKLEKVMERCGVEATGIINEGKVIPDVTIEHAVNIDQEKLPGYLAAFIVFNEDEQEYKASWIVNPDYKIFDYAALESVLPDWAIGCFAAFYDGEEGIDIFFNIPEPHVFEGEVDEVGKAIHNLLKKIINSRGSEKLNAMCDLILLLDENGIELKRCENE